MVVYILTTGLFNAPQAFDNRTSALKAALDYFKSDESKGSSIVHFGDDQIFSAFRQDDGSIQVTMRATLPPNSTSADMAYVVGHALANRTT